MTDKVVNDLFSYFPRLIANTFYLPRSGVCRSYLPSSIFLLPSSASA
jgi:hypothetical protein